MCNISADFSIGTDGDDVEGDVFTAAGKGSAHGMAKTPAAGYGHPCHGDALDVIVLQNLRELLGIVCGIQLGAADEGGSAVDEVPVEAAIAIGGAVCGNQQVSALQSRRDHGGQPQLHREIGEAAGGIRSFTADGNAAADRTGAAALRLRLLCRENGSFIVGRGFPLFKADGGSGAGGETVAKTVAVVLTQQLCFAIHHADGTLMAGFGAKTAADTFFFVYGNDFTDHGSSSFNACVHYTG